MKIFTLVTKWTFLDPVWQSPRNHPGFHDAAHIVTTFIEIKRLEGKIPDSEKIIVTTHKNFRISILVQ